MLAGVIAGGLYTIIGPLFTVVFPRFSQLVAQGKDLDLSVLYHRASQVMSVALLPIALVLIFFSREVMLLWTGDSAIAEKSYLLVSLLTVGTALNGLMNVPYALQLAHGWTKLAFYGNCIAIIILAPAVVLLATHFGAVLRMEQHSHARGSRQSERHGLVFPEARIKLRPVMRTLYGS